MELIDKDALVAEIERRIGELFTLDKASYEVGLVDAYKIMLSFLDTLEVKKVDLEKEFDKYTKDISAQDIKYEPFTQLFECAKHFFELGLQAQKGGINYDRNKSR